MLTHFAWVEAGAKFDPVAHGRCDLDILDLTIDHREGEVAIATVVVPKATLPPWNQRHVFISYGQTLLFSGRLVGLPLGIKKDLISLELTAEPLDAGEQLQKMSADLKQIPYWDPSFVETTELDNPAEWLEARSALFAWDRVEGSVCLSDLFQGRQTLTLTDAFFSDSLNIRLAETPLSHISVNLTAEWVQKAQGEVSLGRKISSAFQEGMVNTLTLDGLLGTWPKEGQKLGRSGYWVERSSLQQVTPPPTGILNIYPTLTPEVMAWDEKDQKPKAIRAVRFWMMGTLNLGWKYRQRRREIVQFTITQKTQLEGKIRPLTRTLNLRLQQVVPEDTGTFFLTLQGRRTIEHALEMVKAHLAASARCLEVEMTLPFEAGFPLSLDHSIHIKDPRIPGGEVTGKVIAYRLHQDGLKSFAWLRFVASIGGNPTYAPAKSDTYYADSSYGDTVIPMAHKTISGLVYENYACQRPTMGIVDTDNLSSHDILKNIYVSHDALRQIQILQNQQYPARFNVRSILEEVPTIISLDLLNLKTTGVAEHIIRLNVLTQWVAPGQVNIEGVEDEI
jgi:hypothetical protein